jgi:hypothetical protein
VAFRTPVRALAPAQEAFHDIALRLERSRWNGMVEPRVLLRALCPTRAGRLRPLGEAGSFWERLVAAYPPPALAQRAAGPAPAPLSDRRNEGFAGVAGDLLTSGEPTVVAVADVARRREGLEAVVAGLAADALSVVAWGSLEADGGLLHGFDHLVALDPPPLGARDPLLGLGPRAHLAWGPAEAEFALCVWRDELDLRPALTEVYRALRELPAGAGPDALEAALGGSRTHPRSPEACARLLAVLSELELAEVRPEERSCRVLEAGRVDLERSPTHRRARERLAAVEAALAAELPGAPAVRAA